MENSFERIKNVISRLRDVLKCQKCFDLKSEEKMLFYRSCDHFFCSECMKSLDSCLICVGSVEKPREVINEKCILSLYQSLIKFELPSRNDIKVIYETFKQSKEISALRQKNKKDKKLPSHFKEDMPENVGFLGSSVVESQNVKKRSRSKGNVSKVDNAKTQATNVNIATVKMVVEDTPKQEFTKKLGLNRKRNNKKHSLTSETENISPKGMTDKSKATPNKRKSLVSVQPRTPDVSSSNANTTPVREGKGRTAIGGEPGSSKPNKSGLKININKRNPKGETQLHLACKKSDFDTMTELIKAGANPNAKDNAGWTPLHDSVFSGNVEVIKFLLENGAKVNIPGLENTTALHEAIAKGNPKMVKLLLEYGADVNAMNIFRETPLDLVTKYNFTELKTILLTSKPKSEVADKDIEEPTETIYLYKHNLPVEEEKLVNKFAEKFSLKLISSIKSKNETPTHVIVSKGQFDVTWALIKSIFVGSWLVTVDWIKDCIDTGVLKSVSSYDVSENKCAGFSRSRLNQKNQLPELFCGCHFFFGGVFDFYNVRSVTVSKEELKRAIEKNGGKILKRSPNPESLTLEKTIPYHADPSGSLKDTSHYIIYQKDKWDPCPKYAMPHVKTLPVDWLLACIYRFELIDPKKHSEPYL